jgi:tRNA(Arg) A34 adenosine deaminase TadA
MDFHAENVNNEVNVNHAAAHAEISNLIQVLEILSHFKASLNRVAIIVTTECSDQQK